MRKLISSILKEASEAKTKQERIDILRKNYDPAIVSLLHYIFNPHIKWCLPKGKIDFKPLDENMDQEGNLYASMKKMYLFLEGGAPNLEDRKRLNLFIQILESLDLNEALLLINAKDKKMPYKYITENLVREAYPDCGL